MYDERVRSVPGVTACAASVFLNVVKWSPRSNSALPPSGQKEPIELDDGDQELLRLLRQNGRTSFRDLAAATGMTYGHARRRTRAMIESGAVRIITSVNPVATGSAVMTAVGLRVDGPVAPVVRAVADLPEVEVAVSTIGQFDLWLEVACRNREHLSEFVGSTLRSLDGVSLSQTYPYAKVIKLPVQWSADALAGVVSRGGG